MAQELMIDLLGAKKIDGWGWWSREDALNNIRTCLAVDIFTDVALSGKETERERETETERELELENFITQG